MMALLGVARHWLKYRKVLSADVSCWEEGWMRCLEEVTVIYIHRRQSVTMAPTSVGICWICDFPRRWVSWLLPSGPNVMGGFHRKKFLAAVCVVRITFWAVYCH